MDPNNAISSEHVANHANQQEAKRPPKSGQQYANTLCVKDAMESRDYGTTTHFNKRKHRKVSK